MAEPWSAEAATVKYNDNVSFNLQERPGKLAPLAGSSDNYAGSVSAKIDNRFGDINLQKKTTRNGDTNNIDPSVFARFIRKPGSANVAPLIDRDDQKETTVELASPVVTQTANGTRRYHDDQFMVGFWGNGYTGKTGEIAVPFKAGNKVAGNFGAAGLVGLTKAKLIEIRRKLTTANVDLENEQVIMLLDADAQSDLLQIEEYVNVDYTGQKVLDTGELKPWLGFRFIPANLGQQAAYPDSYGLFNVGGVNRLPVFVPSGLHRGVWTEFWGKVSERSDKQHSWQFFAEAESAVVRVDEDKCWFVETKPAAA